MNDVELMYTPAAVESRNGLSGNKTSFDDINSFNDTEFATTTEIPVTTPEGLNHTVLDTMLSAVQRVQNSIYPNMDHSYYIYIWTIGIIGCVLLTLWR